MIQSFNFTNTEEELALFAGVQDMKEFALQHGCTGIELQPLQDPRRSYLVEHTCKEEISWQNITNMTQITNITPGTLIQGLHLSFWNNWMDLWQGNEAGLLEEFGDWETVETYYGGRSGNALIQKLRQELELAEELKVTYVVFHVSEITIAQSYHRQFTRTDEEVVDAACAFINELLDGRQYSFEFLMENLWGPGLNYQRPEIVQRLLDGVHYAQKGLMLDTGHLMNTNPELTDQKEALTYIGQTLRRQEPILPMIRGVHLNASISGAYVKQVMAHPPKLAENYWDRWSQAFSHIFQMDQHRPFSEPGVRELIEWIQPAYLTHELISSSREELGELLEVQQRALQGHGE